MTFVQLEASLQVHAIAAGGTNAQMTLPTAGGPTGGTFTLSFGGFTTTSLPYLASAAQVQAALGALPSITTTGVLATGGPLNTTDIVLNFIGPLSNTPLTLITANNASATGGTVVPASTTTGVVTAAKVTNELGTVPSSMAQATWTVGRMSFVSPTAVTGVTANCFTIQFLQYRAGAQVAILGGYTTVAGNSLVASTEVVVPTYLTPSILAGDAIVCQTQMVGGTGLAVPIGINAKIELE